MLPKSVSPDRLAWLTGILTALLAAFLLPRNDPFPYSFKTGHYWNYPDLHAPFDLQATVRRDSISDRLPIQYFTENAEIAFQQKQLLHQLIEAQAKISRNDAQYEDLIAHTGSYQAAGSALLDEIFRRGIVLQQPDTSAILWLHNGDRAVRMIPDSLVLFSDAPRTAGDLLMAGSAVRQPELLAPLVEKALKPNIFFSDSLTRLFLGGRLPTDIPDAVSVRRGQLIVQRSEQITPEKAALLDTLADTLRAAPHWRADWGYLLFSMLGIFSLSGWLKYYRPEAFLHRRKLLLAQGAVLTALALIAATYRAGAAVPLLLPLYLMPLALRPVFGLRTAIVIWSVPVILTGFALDWGMLWASVQIAGAGIALIQNDHVHTWKDRSVTLGVIFLAQTLVWAAFFLAEKAPEAVRTFDTILFIGIAALLSLTRAMLVRFFKSGVV